MSRPVCWVCSRQLMYVSGKPVFAVIVDPIGAEHKVHKHCAKQDQLERAEEKRAAYSQWTGRRA